MMIYVLALGVVLWAYSHSMKRVTPGFRARLGQRGKALAGILSLIGILLMIWGFQRAAVIQLWMPDHLATPWLWYLNNWMMVAAVILVTMPFNRGVMRTWFRNPMLMAVILWAAAHLLVNGDLRAFILFGGMLIWAVGDMIAIDRMEPEWQRPARGSAWRDIWHLAIATVVFWVVAGIHAHLGEPPIDLGIRQVISGVLSVLHHR